MTLSPRALTGFVVANVAASLLHFADNVARFDLYPEPTWLNAPLVAGLWFLQSAVGVIGLVLHRRGRPAGRWVLVAYGVLGLAGLGHYVVAMGKPMDAAMHALIALEAVAAAALLVALPSAPVQTPAKPAAQ